MTLVRFQMAGSKEGTNEHVTFSAEKTKNDMGRPGMGYIASKASNASRYTVNNVPRYGQQ